MLERAGGVEHPVGRVDGDAERGGPAAQCVRHRPEADPEGLDAVTVALERVWNEGTEALEQALASTTTAVDTILARVAADARDVRRAITGP